MILHEPNVSVSLDDYAALAQLSGAVAALRAEAGRLVPIIGKRTIWMVNSAAQGRGVAELLPAQSSLLRQLGLDVRWAVLDAKQPAFFAFTKRLHNLIHASPEPPPEAGDQVLYDDISRRHAHELATMVASDDILVVHDPQPLGVGTLLTREVKLHTIWRCHIGVEDDTPATRSAWQFLQPYLEPYQAAVFTTDEYVPDFLRARSTIIHPTIDPLGHKNRDLSLHKLVGILCDAQLAEPHWPLLSPPFEHSAQRLQSDGTFAVATVPEDIGLLARPIITQVSRWDRLKGFGPLLHAFEVLKRDPAAYPYGDSRQQRRLAAVRLVLVGPQPGVIEDDPEAKATLAALSEQYLSLDAAIRRDIAVITLPLASRKDNALMVNALQRCSDIVVQNSLREGFGLTVTEALWKRTAVMGSARACGVRSQVRDGVDGLLAPDPENVQSLARIMGSMLADEHQLEEWGRNAQRHVHDHFLIFSELQQWLELLARQVAPV